MNAVRGLIFLLCLCASIASADNEVTDFRAVEIGDIVTLPAGFSFPTYYSNRGRSHSTGPYCYTRIISIPKGIGQNIAAMFDLYPDPAGAVANTFTLAEETRWQVRQVGGSAFGAMGLGAQAEYAIMIRCEAETYPYGTEIPEGSLEALKADGILVQRPEAELQGSRK